MEWVQLAKLQGPEELRKNSNCRTAILDCHDPNSRYQITQYCCPLITVHYREKAQPVKVTLIPWVWPRMVMGFMADLKILLTFCALHLLLLFIFTKRFFFLACSHLCCCCCIPFTPWRRIGFHSTHPGRFCTKVCWHLDVLVVRATEYRKKNPARCKTQRIYCIAGNFRQWKISSKAAVGQFVGNLFSSNVGCRSFVLRSLGRRSFAYCLSAVTFVNISDPTLVVLWKKIGQEFNLVKKLLWRN